MTRQPVSTRIRMWLWILSALRQGNARNKQSPTSFWVLPPVSVPQQHHDHMHTCTDENINIHITRFWVLSTAAITQRHHTTTTLTPEQHSSMCACISDLSKNLSCDLNTTL